MGFDHSQLTRLAELFPSERVRAEAAKVEAARQEELRLTELAQHRMAHALADTFCPEDIKDWGRRHGIENFSEAVWNAGFIAGFRAATSQQGGADAAR